MRIKLAILTLLILLVVAGCSRDLSTEQNLCVDSSEKDIAREVFNTPEYLDYYGTIPLTFDHPKKIVQSLAKALRGNDIDEAMNFAEYNVDMANLRQEFYEILREKDALGKYADMLEKLNLEKQTKEYALFTGQETFESRKDPLDVEVYLECTPFGWKVIRDPPVPLMLERKQS